MQVCHVCTSDLEDALVQQGFWVIVLCQEPIKWAEGKNLQGFGSANKNSLPEWTDPKHPTLGPGVP